MHLCKEFVQGLAALLLHAGLACLQAHARLGQLPVAGSQLLHDTFQLRGLEIQKAIVVILQSTLCEEGGGGHIQIGNC